MARTNSFLKDSDPESRKLRVLLANEFFYPDSQGGTGTATSHIASRLSNTHGAEVTVVTSRFAYRDHSVLYDKTGEWDGVSIHRVNSPNWLRASMGKRFVGNLLFSMSVVQRALTLPKPDVMLVTTAPLTLPIAARLLHRLRGVPYVYLIYDLDPDRAVALKVKDSDDRAVRLLRRSQKAWLHGAESVVAIGRCMRDHLVREYGVPAEKVAVVEVGADPDVTRPLPRDTAFRRKHAIDGFVALYSGNFGQYHDFQTLLDGAARLRETNPDVTFVLVGGGHKKREVEEQVARRGLTNVRLFPFVPEEELSDLLASADMSLVTLEPGMEGLCVPSKFYTCLASGRATLALVPEATEVAMAVAESDCGLRVDIGDVDGFVRAIQEAQASPERLLEQGHRARQVFDEQYTIDRTVAKLYNVLRERRDASKVTRFAQQFRASGVKVGRSEVPACEAGEGSTLSR